MLVPISGFSATLESPIANEYCAGVPGTTGILRKLPVIVGIFEVHLCAGANDFLLCAMGDADTVGASTSHLQGLRCGEDS